MLPDTRFYKAVFTDASEADIDAGDFKSALSLAKEMEAKQGKALHYLLFGNHAPSPFEEAAYDTNGNKDNVHLLADQIVRGLQSRNILVVALCAKTANEILDR